MSPELSRLENALGHRFKDRDLLETAVTHRSWANENAGAGNTTERPKDNESLEFIGDSVIGLAVAEQLYLRNPELTEGDLTLMKHSLVSGNALANVSERLGLGEYLRLGGSEVKGGRTKRGLLTNAFEAVIGAVFLDAGYITARYVVTRLMEDMLQTVTPQASIDFKSRLQTQLQAIKKQPAKYILVESEGPPHNRTFPVRVEWDGGTASGDGNSIKAAEMAAAAKALDRLGENGDERRNAK